MDGLLSRFKAQGVCVCVCVCVWCVRHHQDGSPEPRVAEEDTLKPAIPQRWLRLPFSILLTTPPGVLGQHLDWIYRGHRTVTSRAGAYHGQTDFRRRWRAPTIARRLFGAR